MQTFKQKIKILIIILFFENNAISAFSLKFPFKFSLKWLWQKKRQAELLILDELSIGFKNENTEDSMKMNIEYISNDTVLHRIESNKLFISYLDILYSYPNLFNGTCNKVKMMIIDKDDKQVADHTFALEIDAINKHATLKDKDEVLAARPYEPQKYNHYVNELNSKHYELFDHHIEIQARYLSAFCSDMIGFEMHYLKQDKIQYSKKLNCNCLYYSELLHDDPNLFYSKFDAIRLSFYVQDNHNHKSTVAAYTFKIDRNDNDIILKDANGKEMARRQSSVSNHVETQLIDLMDDKIAIRDQSAAIVIECFHQNGQDDVNICQVARLLKHEISYDQIIEYYNIHHCKNIKVKFIIPSKKYINYEEIVGDYTFKVEFCCPYVSLKDMNGKTLRKIDTYSNRRFAID